MQRFCKDSAKILQRFCKAFAKLLQRFGKDSAKIHPTSVCAHSRESVSSPRQAAHSADQADSDYNTKDQYGYGDLGGTVVIYCKGKVHDTRRPVTTIGTTDDAGFGISDKASVHKAQFTASYELWYLVGY